MSGAGIGLAWQVVGTVLHLAGAASALIASTWLVGRRRRIGPAANGLTIALIMTALWALLAGIDGAGSQPAALAEVLRNLALLYALYCLFATDGRHSSVPQVRLVMLSLVLVESLLLGLRAIQVGDWDRATGAALFEAGVMLRLLSTIGGLVLVHNLHAGAESRARRSLRWPALGIAAMWLLDFNLYTVAYLLARWPFELASLHGLGVSAMAALVALVGAHNREALRIRPSRQVAFRSLSLIGVVAYLLAVTAIGRGLSALGGDFARAVQFALPLAALVAALLILPSPRLRSWLRVMVTKHLFDHRYDYRQEWLRVTATIGRAEPNGPPLPERTVQAMAEITESPAGLLLLPDDEGGLTLAARWRWPGIEIPAVALDAAAVAQLERESWIVDLDAMRADREQARPRLALPRWLHADTQAWAVVPLLHFDRLVGAAVLARPAYPRRLDWEDLDMLRVVGRQVASYLAEQTSQVALAEAGRFDDFNRRIAFVMHDIKNLASQLSLLARNAERHAENPEFRADMLVTLRNSADKLNALLSRLSRYGASAVGPLRPVDLEVGLEGVVSQFAGRHQVTVVETQSCRVKADPESLEQVLLHLVQNAIDASPPRAPVLVRLWRDATSGVIEVVDTGHGMSPEFVRTKLFKPFVSSKPGGFGIGAYEARELTRAMGGRLEVESHEGLGTRFIVRLPLDIDLPLSPDAAQPGDDQKVA
jgi:putative PEP-CTERM system histidine kinase